MQYILIVNYFLVAISFSSFFVLSQNDGPAPPRLNIPGAIPIPIRPQFRNEKYVGGGGGGNSGGIVRIRRPVLRPLSNSLPLSVTPKLIDEPKPVTEEPEDNIPDPFIPQLISQSQPSQQQQQQQQQQQSQHFSEPNSIQQDSPIIDEISIQQQQRFQQQERPIPQSIQTIGGQRFSIPSDHHRLERPKQQLVRSQRPSSYRDSRPQQQIHEHDHVNKQLIAERRTITNTQYSKPITQTTSNNEIRLKKPVAQTLRKWTEEHDDGSITWGFENDDGSFKEETIGVDCVTRGRYGYVDPDGVKREYNYETGILCDPNKRDQNPEIEQSAGFVDYEGNKAVLPNGVEIDLTNMGKKKSKRPGAILQQQQSQQQYYRN